MSCRIYHINSGNDQPYCRLWKTSTKTLFSIAIVAKSLLDTEDDRELSHDLQGFMACSTCNQPRTFVTRKKVDTQIRKSNPKNPPSLINQRFQKNYLFSSLKIQGFGKKNSSTASSSSSPNSSVLNAFAPRHAWPSFSGYMLAQLGFFQGYPVEGNLR